MYIPFRESESRSWTRQPSRMRGALRTSRGARKEKRRSNERTNERTKGDTYIKCTYGTMVPYKQKVGTYVHTYVFH